MTRADSNAMAIEHCINAANTIGGTVYFPRGTYFAHDVSLKSDVKLTGSAPRAVTLQQPIN